MSIGASDSGVVGAVGVVDEFVRTVVEKERRMVPLK